jgi:hypothetical protein
MAVAYDVILCPWCLPPFSTPAVSAFLVSQVCLWFSTLNYFFSTKRFTHFSVNPVSRVDAEAMLQQETDNLPVPNS